MRKKIIIILIALIIVLSGVAGGGYYVYSHTVNIDTIYTGIKIDGFDVGGLTQEEAFELISEEKQSQISEKSMELNHNDDKFTIGLEDVGFDYDYDKAVEEAYNLGRAGSVFKRYKKIKSIAENGENISLESDFKSSKIKSISEDIAEDLDIESKDAIFNFNGGNFQVSQEKVGQKVDKEELSKLIEENIYELEDIEIPVDKVEPKYTKKHYESINGIIGEYSTGYASSPSGRKHNIRLSTEQFNGKLLNPGDTLSYNQTVGTISKDTGYQEASVIMDGDFQTGVGGGICQTSTTLYNALLLADLTIVERSPHSIPIGYVNKGMDAAVAEGWKDLKFRNDFDFPVYLRAKTEGDKVYFYVYGDKNAKDYQVKMESKLIQTIPHKVTEKIDKNAKPGSREVAQQGRDGYRTETYKYKIKNGKVIESKKISTDYYPERDSIVNVGP